MQFTPVFVVGTGRSGTRLFFEVMRRHPQVSAYHELHAMSAAFERYCEWNKLEVDHGAFLALKRADIDQACIAGKVYVEASAYLTFSIERLFREFNARFVLVVRDPSHVVFSLANKGWYDEPVRDEDCRLALGYAELGQPHHGFSRIAPRGQYRERWKALTRVGRLAWYWSTANQAALDAFAMLPPGNRLIVKLESFDFAKYHALMDFMSLQPVLAQAEFDALCGSRPGHIPAHQGHAAALRAESEEFREQVAPLAQYFGYSTSLALPSGRVGSAARQLRRSVQPLNRLPPILATLGASNCDPAAVDWMIERGIRGFRINLARWSLPEADRLLRRLNEHNVASELSLLVDLPGRKMRVARFMDGPSLTVEKGERLPFVLHGTLPSNRSVPIATPEFLKEISATDTLTFSGSTAVVRVVDVTDSAVLGEVIAAGVLVKGCGIWIVGPYRPYEELWTRDRDALEMLVRYDVHIGVSFADTKEVIRGVRSLAASRSRVVAKIESPAAIAAWPSLLPEADAIMIGRDDLSRFLPMNVIDDWIARHSADALRSSKPLITASHYFDSIHENGVISPRDRAVASQVFQSGLILCLSETGHSANWQTMIDEAISCAAT